MPSPLLDARISQLRAQPGRTWGVRDAVLAMAAVPLVLGVAMALVDAGLSLPGVALPVLASAGLAGCAYVVGLRPAVQSGGWASALGLELPEWSDVPRVVGWTVLLLVGQLALFAVLLLAVPPLRDVEPESNVGILEEQSLGTLLVLAVLTVTVAPVVEELRFRGIALRGLMLRTGFWPAAVVSTACFAALHVPALTAGSVFVVVAIAWLGLALCVLTRRAGRLGPAIGVHALHNAVVFAVTVLTA